MRVLLPALLALSVLLAGTLAAEVALPPAAPDAAAATGIRLAPRQPRLDAARAGVPLQDHSDAWVTTILARPLFSRDRRPPDATTAAAGEDAGGPPRLTGIAVSPAGRSAIFAGSAGGKAIVVSEGGSVGGFTVQAIQPDQVRLDGPGGTRTLSPAFDPNQPVLATNEARPPGFPQPGYQGQSFAAPLAPGMPLQLPGRPFVPPRFGNGPFVPGRFNPAGNAATAQP